MNQKQCKRQRKAAKWLDQERERFQQIRDWLERRPPMWRVLAYIKWRREGQEGWWR